MMTNYEQKFKFGKWKKLVGNYVTAGGDPVFVCGKCGGSSHVYGIEHQTRRQICEKCGSINSYPWEKVYEEVSE